MWPAQGGWYRELRAVRPSKSSVTSWGIFYVITISRYRRPDRPSSNGALDSEILARQSNLREEHRVTRW